MYGGGVSGSTAGFDGLVQMGGRQYLAGLGMFTSRMGNAPYMHIGPGGTGYGGVYDPSIQRGDISQISKTGPDQPPPYVPPPYPDQIPSGENIDDCPACCLEALLSNYGTNYSIDRLCNDQYQRIRGDRTSWRRIYRSVCCGAWVDIISYPCDGDLNWPIGRCRHNCCRKCVSEDPLYNRIITLYNSYRKDYNLLGKLLDWLETQLAKLHPELADLIKLIIDCIKGLAPFSWYGVYNCIFQYISGESRNDVIDLLNKFLANHLPKLTVNNMTFCGELFDPSSNEKQYDCCLENFSRLTSVREPGNIDAFAMGINCCVLRKQEESI
jgi:hypothetical protein